MITRSDSYPATRPTMPQATRRWISEEGEIRCQENPRMREKRGVSIPGTLSAPGVEPGCASGRKPGDGEVDEPGSDWVCRGGCEPLPVRRKRTVLRQRSFRAYPTRFNRWCYRELCGHGGLGWLAGAASDTRTERGTTKSGPGCDIETRAEVGHRGSKGCGSSSRQHPQSTSKDPHAPR